MIPSRSWPRLAATLRGAKVEARAADVVTTIVPAIQARLFELLAQYPRAAGVVLDPRTGAVLALASVPSYDPNDFDAAFASLRVDPGAPLLDRALDGLYPPGSTFKMFTAAAALDSNTVTMDSRFDDPGYLVIGDTTLHDNEGEATGDADLTTAFALSSNVDFGQIALKMGIATFYDYLRRWSVGDSLDFQLPAQSARVPAEVEHRAGRARPDGLRTGRTAHDAAADGVDRRDDRQRRRRTATLRRPPGRSRRTCDQLVADGHASKPGIRRDGLER